jgi:hypothetical protein
VNVVIPSCPLPAPRESFGRQDCVLVGHKGHDEGPSERLPDLSHQAGIHPGGHNQHKVNCNFSILNNQMNIHVCLSNFD